MILGKDKTLIISIAPHDLSLWFDSTSGDDNNDGLSKFRPKRTEKAIGRLMPTQMPTRTRLSIRVRGEWCGHFPPARVRGDSTTFIIFDGDPWFDDNSPYARLRLGK